MADFPNKTLADWEKLAAKELRERPLGDLTWMTPEGIAVKPLYTAADLEQLETLGSLATIRTTRAWWATSARRAWRSIPSRT